jgi:hypothetical protein
MSGKAWAAIAVGLTLFIAATAAVMVFNRGPTYPAVSRTTSSVPTSGPPPHSKLMPVLALRAGATKRDYTAFESWDVPAAYADTVDTVRPQLPIGKVYDGLAWCSEFISARGDLTTWSWGAESDYLSVRVTPAAIGDGSEVTVAREPHPAGCRR